jgi:hypothetical protein
VTFHRAGGMLRGNTAAVKALSSLMRMLRSQLGSGKAIEHWRGSCSTPLDQNPSLANPGCRVRQVDSAMQENRDKNSKPDNQAGIEGLPVIRPDVAGIDLGSETHWVCAPNVDRTGLEVETFGATTPELERMAEWLKERRIESVAMESTGVYWIAPHEVLERHGLEVVLVNTSWPEYLGGRRLTGWTVGGPSGYTVADC